MTNRDRDGRALAPGAMRGFYPCPFAFDRVTKALIMCVEPIKERMQVSVTHPYRETGLGDPPRMAAEALMQLSPGLSL